MPHRIAQNVSLAPEHAAFIASQVAAGHNANVSAVVRTALALLMARQRRENTKLKCARGGNAE